jgi:hypothetical protein
LIPYTQLAVVAVGVVVHTPTTHTTSIPTHTTTTTTIITVITPSSDTHIAEATPAHQTDIIPAPLSPVTVFLGLLGLLVFDGVRSVQLLLQSRGHFRGGPEKKERNNILSIVLSVNVLEMKLGIEYFQQTARTDTDTHTHTHTHMTPTHTFDLTKL